MKKRAHNVQRLKWQIEEDWRCVPSVEGQCLHSTRTQTENLTNTFYSTIMMCRAFTPLCYDKSTICGGADSVDFYPNLSNGEQTSLMWNMWVQILH